MKPRASANFCHWPNDSSTPYGHVGPSCVSRPDVRRATTSPAPARSTAVTTAGSSSSRGTSPKPTVCPARNSKRKKSWNAPARRACHSTAGRRASGVSSTRIEPDDGSYIFASSLTSVVLPAPFSPTMATTAPAGSVTDTSSSTTREVPGYANDTWSSLMPRRNTARSNAGDTHFLTGRGRRGDGEQVTRQPIGLCSTLLRGSLDLGPPGRRQHGRDREHREQEERRVNRRQQRHRHAQPQDPPERGKQRH